MQRVYNCCILVFLNMSLAMDRLLSLILITTTLTLVSCKQEVTKSVEKVGSMEEEKGLSCMVTVPAGDAYAAFSHLEMPPFFNIGQFKTETKTTEVIILSSRKDKGDQIKVDVIGLFGFKQDTLNKHFIVALPRQKGVNNLERQYDEYLIKNNDMKLAIESWFRAQCGVSICGAFYWDNPYKALIQLEEN